MLLNFLKHIIFTLVVAGANEPGNIKKIYLFLEESSKIHPIFFFILSV